VVIYGPGAFAAIVLPLASAAGDQLERQRKLLGTTLALVAGMATLAATVFTVFPELIVKLLMGSRYLEMAAYLPTYAWAMVLGIVATVLINYLVARHSRRVLLPLAAGLATELIYLGFLHQTFGQFAMANLVSNAVFLAAAVATYLHARRKD
jgi:O-antigen/teichoic acid export membrane protein